MARIVGVDIPTNKRLEIALTYVYGVGRTTSLKVCAALGLDPGMKSRDLTEEQTTTLANHLNKEYTVEGELRRQLAQDMVSALAPTPVVAKVPRRPWPARSPSRA